MVEIKDIDSYEALLKGDKLVILYFGAAWCPPCKILGPVLERVSDSRDDVEIVKVDADGPAPEILMAHSVRNLPTMVLMQNGKMIHRVVGAMSEKKVNDLINDQLGIDEQE